MLQDYIYAMTDAEARIKRLTAQITGLMSGWNPAPVVEAIQAMREVPKTSLALQLVQDRADVAIPDPVFDFIRSIRVFEITYQQRHSSDDRPIH